MKVSPVTDAPHMVFHLADGNMLLQHDSNKVFDQHLGIFSIAEKQKSDWKERLSSRKKIKNINNYCFLIAPDKHSIYWSSFSNESDTRVSNDIFTDELETIKIDVVNELLAAEQEYKTFPDTDTHWNDWGAMIAANKVLGVLGKPALSKSHYRFVNFEFTGDLGRKLTPPVYENVERIDKSSLNSELVFDNNIPDNGRVRLRINDDQTGKLILFGDSFSYNLVDYLAERFNLTLHFHTTGFDRTIVDYIGNCDVISEVTERFLIHSPRYSEEEGVLGYLREKKAAGINPTPRVLTPKPEYVAIVNYLARYYRI